MPCTHWAGLAVIPENGHLTAVLNFPTLLSPQTYCTMVVRRGRGGPEMLTLRIDVDQETYERLVDEAVGERRPIPNHAGVVLRRAFGLAFPESPHSNPCANTAGARPAETVTA